MTRTSIVIVNHNTGQILRECVDSIYRFEDSSEFEIIIFDNCSSDDSLQIIDTIVATYPAVRKIISTEKKSFSAANNIAIEASSGEYLLILNPDIIFQSPLIAGMKSLLERDSGTGAACPLLVGTDGEFQRRYFQRYPGLLQYIFFYSLFAKIFMKSRFLTNRYLHDNKIGSESEKIYEVEQIPCAFFFTKRKVYEEAGGLNESFELFFEDVDLSFQIHKKRKLLLDTSLSVQHLGGESFRASDDYWLYGRFIVSMITFFRINYSSLKTSSLKLTSSANSHAAVFFEKVLGIFGKKSEYRLRKHRYFLAELKKMKA